MSLLSFAGAAATGGPELDLDLTMVGQMGLFLVLMLVLKPVLFDPMLRLFEEREKRIDGAKLEARAIDQKSAGALAQYEGAMAKARGEANAERDRIRAEGTKAEQEILGRVRLEVQKRLESGRAEVQAQAGGARGTLRTTAKDLARDIASRVLGREVQG